MASTNELLDLLSVHRFYVAVLERNLSYQIPLPQGVMQAQSAAEQKRELIIDLLRWLGVLDLAISPPMVRDQLNATKHHESAEALLRYYVKKSSISDLDRDKADCVLGFLCRHPKPNSAGFLEKLPTEAHQLVADAARDFRTEMDRILAGNRASELPTEHGQLLREFEFLYHELIDFRTFDQLMDCGILGRIHDLKKSFGASFYHSEVLSVVGVFNGIFGKRFDDLFLQATQHIKSFAKRVQQEGTSIMSRVDGEVRVKHLAELEEDKILDKEYTRAREDFEKISSFKKAVDKRRAQTPSIAQARAASEPGSVADSASGFEPLGGQSAEQVTAPFMMAQVSVEEYKFRHTCEQIRTFVRAADPKVCFTVPLPKRNLALTPAEADAFRSDYAAEESFRSRYADALVKLVTAKARTSLELLEFQQKQSSAYLWKPHADSLMYLIKLFERLQDQAAAAVAAAEERGLKEKAAVLKTALGNLQSELQNASRSLQTLEISAG
ncbi:MAG TPA: hypothetical protein VJ453_13860 [Terriglobales bacterium]|nr:hypothetical protein [Terriglobales bacterium]